MKKDCPENKRNNNSNNNNNKRRGKEQQVSFIEKEAYGSGYNTGRYEEDAALYAMETIETALIEPDEELKVPVYFKLYGKTVVEPGFMDGYRSFY